MVYVHAPVAYAFCQLMRNQEPCLANAVNTLGMIISEFPTFEDFYGWQSTFYTPKVSLAELQRLVDPYAARWRAKYSPRHQIEMIDLRYNEMPHKQVQADELDLAVDYGIWWSTPCFKRPPPGKVLMDCHRGETTPGPFLDAPCVRAYLQEDATGCSPWLIDPDDPDGETLPRDTFQFRPYPYEPAQPVVYEISTPEDWTNLVNRYPLARIGSPFGWPVWTSGHDMSDQAYDIQRKSGSTAAAPAQFVGVNWKTMAKDYDAVHLTFMGYLLGAYKAIHTDHGLTTLAGWGPDLTCWIR